MRRALLVAGLACVLVWGLALPGCQADKGAGNPPAGSQAGGGGQGPGGSSSSGSEGPTPRLDGEITGIDPTLCKDWVLRSGDDDFQLIILPDLEAYTSGIRLNEDGTAMLIVSSHGDLTFTESDLTWQADGQRLVIMKDGELAVSSVTGATMLGSYSRGDLTLTFTLDSGQVIVFGILAT